VRTMERTPSTKTDKSFILNLGGPDGNAYMLMGITKRFVTQLGGDADKVIAEMMSDTYEHLLKVMCREVGQFIYFTDVPEQYIDTLEEAVDAYGKPIEFEYE